MVPRQGPSLTRWFVTWRYRRAKARLREVYAEWSKLHHPGYCTVRLLRAEERVIYWRKQLQDLSG